MAKKSRQKLKYFENEKSFLGEIKSILYCFWRAFSCQKLSQTWECTFNLSGKAPVTLRLYHFALRWKLLENVFQANFQLLAFV